MAPARRRCFNLIHGELRIGSRRRAVRRSLATSICRRMPSRGGASAARSRSPATFASMTVRESVALALAAHDDRDGGAVRGLLDDELGADRRSCWRGLHIDDLADAHCALAGVRRRQAARAGARARRRAAAAADGRANGRHDPAVAPRADAIRRRLSRAATTSPLLFTEHDMDIVFGFARPRHRARSRRDDRRWNARDGSSRHESQGSVSGLDHRDAMCRVVTSQGKEVMLDGRGRIVVGSLVASTGTRLRPPTSRSGTMAATSPCTPPKILHAAAVRLRAADAHGVSAPRGLRLWRSHRRRR